MQTNADMEACPNITVAPPEAMLQTLVSAVVRTNPSYSWQVVMYDSMPDQST